MAPCISSTFPPSIALLNESKLFLSPPSVFLTGPGLNPCKSIFCNFLARDLKSFVPCSPSTVTSSCGANVSSKVFTSCSLAIGFLEFLDKNVDRDVSFNSISLIGLNFLVGRFK